MSANVIKYSYTNHPAILLWNGEEIQYALEQSCFARSPIRVEKGVERNRVSATILAILQRFGQETRFLVQFMSHLIMKISYNPEADVLKVFFQESAVEKSDRRAFMQLPLAERRRNILAQQAEAMVEHYEQETARGANFKGGDIIDS